MHIIWPVCLIKASTITKPNLTANMTATSLVFTTQPRGQNKQTRWIVLKIRHKQIYLKYPIILILMFMIIIPYQNDKVTKRQYGMDAWMDAQISIILYWICLLIAHFNSGCVKVFYNTIVWFVSELFAYDNRVYLFG